MSDIPQNNSILDRKMTVSASGKPDDMWIFRMIAQNKGYSLPFTELIKVAKHKGKLTSTYKTLDRLCPESDDIQGVRLFCYNDLIRKTTMPDGEYEELLTKLKTKLKDSYNHFLQWRNWTKIKPHYRSEEKNGSKVITITIGLDKNRLTILRLETKHNDDLEDKDKAMLTLRRKKLKRTDNISNYAEADKMILTFCHCGGINSDLLSFKIKKNYIAFKVPLFPEWKGDKLYFRTLAEKSYYFKKLSYLDSTLNDKGHRLVKSYEERLLSLSNSSNFKIDKDKIYRLREKISKINYKKEYQTLSINIRGLLLYALEESNYNELDKSLENLAMSDDYQQIKDSIYAYDEYGEKPRFPTSSYCYQIKKNFPFLSYYNDFKGILLDHYVAKLLRKIARNLKSSLKTTRREHLKYLATQEFFKGIKPLLIQYIRDHDKSDNNVSRAAERYISELSAYIKHVKEKNSTERHNEETLQNVKHRQNLLKKKINILIERNQNSNKVVPIYELIVKSRLLWYQYSSILESIEKTYRNKLTITERCFVSGPKSRDLKLLLKGHPIYDNACRALIENGVPKECFNLDLIDKLGFTQAYQDKNDRNSNIIFVRKKR